MYIISEFKDKFFNEVVIPILIKKQYQGNVNKLKNDKSKLLMEDYLEENFNLTFQDIIDNLLDFISVSEVNGKHIIKIDKDRNYPDRDFTFSSIINLIDNGNLSVKGLHLLDNAMKYIQNKLWYIHNMCERGVKIWA